MRRGDGKRWGDENFEAPGSVCTSSWRSLAPSVFRESRIGRDDRIDSVEYEHIHDGANPTNPEHEAIITCTKPRLNAGSDGPRFPVLVNARRSRFSRTWSLAGSLELRNSYVAPLDLV